MKRNYDECVTKYSDSFVRVVLDPGYVSRIQNFVTELVEAKSKEDHHKIDSSKEVKRFTTGFLGEAALEKLFGIRSIKGYTPKKPTIIALAIALELSLDETDDLLERAGYALSHASKFDVIVEYFIVSGKYNIFDINEVLFKYDQPLLGG